MSHEAVYCADVGIVESVFDGVVTLEDVLADAVEAIRIARREGTGLFLCDLGNADVRLSNFDVLAVAEKLEAQTDISEMRKALIVPDDDYSQQTVLFFETMFAFRGGRVAAFTDRDAARNWLSGEASAAARHSRNSVR